MASGDVLNVFTPLDNEPPAASYATLDSRNAHPVLDFDAAADESAVFSGVLPANYDGGGLTVDLHFAASGITTGDVIWDVSIEALVAQDLDSDGFAAANSDTQTVSGTDGGIAISTVTFTDGADMDSLAAGGLFRLKVTRDADNGSDTAAADAELVAVVVKET